ncbi:MAG: putative heme d1 biosynthesis radical SAM protein NirJ2 [Firmicutes bacterium]|nr:putative heme d1 biosynthesis radical SAM protein NirJ2 [Bacillota bacterium]
MLVSWNVTRRCNLGCGHCYRDAGPAAAGELSTAEGLALVDEIARAGFRILIFSGGEPLLREDLPDLIARARERGLRPVLGTNGTLIDRAAARELLRAGAAAAGISLDSLRPEYHDRFRGRAGAWRDAVAGMEACRAAGLPFQVHTTVTRHNRHEVEALTDLAVEMGAQAHHVFFLVAVGRAASLADADLDPEGYEELLRRLLLKGREVPIEVKPTCAPQFMRLARQMGVPTRYTRGCLAGIAYCLVGPTGDVQPCAYLDLVVGNVREAPFGEIWRRSPVLAALRAGRYRGRCGRCRYREICGGCRARAFAATGDYLGEEPRCLYEETEAGHAAGCLG